jgi:hypothetical protein
MPTGEDPRKVAKLPDITARNELRKKQQAEAWAEAAKKREAAKNRGAAKKRKS